MTTGSQPPGTSWNGHTSPPAVGSPLQGPCSHRVSARDDSAAWPGQSWRVPKMEPLNYSSPRFSHSLLQTQTKKHLYIFKKRPRSCFRVWPQVHRRAESMTGVHNAPQCGQSSMRARSSRRHRKALRGSGRPTTGTTGRDNGKINGRNVGRLFGKGTFFNSFNELNQNFVLEKRVNAQRYQKLVSAYYCNNLRFPFKNVLLPAAVREEPHQEPDRDKRSPFAESS